MSTSITIIRHAPTVYNKKEIFMGTEDIPADHLELEAGKFRSMRENEYIIRAKRIYTSPLLRARSTAEAIAEGQDKSIQIDDRLTERNLGDWQGMPKALVRQKYPSAFMNGKMNFFYTPQNGEPYDIMVKRVADFLVEKYWECNDLVLVTHNGVFRVMKSLLTGERLNNMFLEFEPYLVPQTFLIQDDLFHTIQSNPFYTVDK